ncbi:MAG: hypothetical protein RMJ51_00195 [Candidatus Calescibacterium sp.]|nr:hypothetical protein [Candidatus Calescibacterium sp.]MCX7972059.1 hypothetical protein [bacterium]MDW8194656.1 hypothetical protein [Candidatus Calescibacterium sp.]
MKIELIVKDKDGNQIYTEPFFVKQKSDIMDVSGNISKRIFELESKYPYPDYQIEQKLSWIQEDKD